MNVSAILVTRGDVDMQPVLDSLPWEWEVVVWGNSGEIRVRKPGGNLDRLWGVTAGDISVYGRYAAIEYASNDLIYCQDDDVIVSDPQAIVDAWKREWRGCVQGSSGMLNLHTACDEFVVCNMPPEFRPHYPDSGLVGFGAAFHRDAPQRAFDHFYGELSQQDLLSFDRDLFQRECDRVFTVLTPRVLVDIPKEDCAYASDPNRMWRSADHIGDRDRMLALARQVRDA